MSEGWQFDVTEQEGINAAGDGPHDKKDYFEALAKMNEDGHSLAEYCQGLGLDDDDGPSKWTHSGVRVFHIIPACRSFVKKRNEGMVKVGYGRKF